MFFLIEQAEDNGYATRYMQAATAFSVSWLHYYRWFTNWNPYGDVSKMPQADQQIIYETFQEHAKKQQDALTDPNEYYPLQIFALPN